MGTISQTLGTAGADRATGPRVLLVEDDRRIAAALGIRLESCGYRVSRAADLNEAADLIVDERPDVAVLDINLPDGNGLQLAERMRLLRSTVGVPLVLVTASRDPSYRARALGLAAPFVEKPFAARELIEAIERACSGGRDTPLENPGSDDGSGPVDVAGADDGPDMAARARRGA